MPSTIHITDKQCVHRILWDPEGSLIVGEARQEVFTPFAFRIESSASAPQPHSKSPPNVPLKLSFVFGPRRRCIWHVNTQC